MRATLRWNDNSEKTFSKEELRYRKGVCSEFNENEDAYQLAIQNIAKVEAFLKFQSEYGDRLISLGSVINKGTPTPIHS